MEDEKLLQTVDTKYMWLLILGGVSLGISITFAVVFWPGRS